jgi:hypothetical protein
MGKGPGLQRSTAVNGMRCLALVAAFTIFVPVLGFGQETIVRDRTGKILERRVQQGDTVKVYDPNSKLREPRKFRQTRPL